MEEQRSRRNERKGNRKIRPSRGHEILRPTPTRNRIRFRRFRLLRCAPPSGFSIGNRIFGGHRLFRNSDGKTAPSKKSRQPFGPNGGALSLGDLKGKDRVPVIGIVRRAQSERANEAPGVNPVKRPQRGRQLVAIAGIRGDSKRDQDPFGSALQEESLEDLEHCLENVLALRTSKGRLRMQMGYRSVRSRGSPSRS